MKLTEALKILLTTDKASEEYKKVFEETKDKTLNSFKLADYFTHCLGGEYFGYKFTEQKLNQIIDFFKAKLAPFATIENAVIVAGRTASGKSTLIHYLAGVEIEEYENNGSPLIRPKHEADTLGEIKILSGIRSQALYPIHIIHNGRTFVELPGVNDIDYAEGVDIANMLSDLALAAIKSINTIIITIGEYATEVNAQYLPKTEKYLVSLEAQFKRCIKDEAPIMYVITRPNCFDFKNGFDARLIQTQIFNRFDHYTTDLNITKNQIFISRPFRCNKKDSLDQKADMLMALNDAEYIKNRSYPTPRFFIDAFELQYGKERLKPVRAAEHSDIAKPKASLS